MKKIIVFIILLILPVFIHAGSKLNYTNSLSDAKTYITRGSFRNTYSRYFIYPSNDKFITVEEFNASKDNNNATYLYDGCGYFTQSESGNQVYVINSYDNPIKVNKTSKYERRDTEIVKSSVKIRGIGSMNSPWRFEPVYEVKIIYDREYAVLTGEDVKYITRGSSAEFTIGSSKSEYKYLYNDCNGTFSNGTFRITNVTTAISCNVIFGTGEIIYPEEDPD